MVSKARQVTLFHRMDITLVVSIEKWLSILYNYHCYTEHYVSTSAVGDSYNVTGLLVHVMLGLKLQHTSLMALQY